ncbi:MAG: NlpC/P60 family protein [Acidobacteriota bacterium]
MRPALRIFLCLPLTLIVLTGIAHLALAQESDLIAVHTRPRTIKLPMVLPAFGLELIRPPHSLGLAAESASLLESTILNKIGIPYRFYGIDDYGYDCSGLVWRVFQESGISFTRMPARALWQTLPEATSDQLTRFGTLVFFNGLTHVGIVRDAFSFYHASSSQGVVLSYFTGYWEKRITGYRVVPSVVPRLAPVLISSGRRTDQR